MIKGKVAPETVDKILERLSSDQDFREQFIGDPAGALKQFGVEVDPDKVPAVRKLPPKEQFARIRQQAAGATDPVGEVGLAIFLLR